MLSIDSINKNEFNTHYLLKMLLLTNRVGKCFIINQTDGSFTKYYGNDKLKYYKWINNRHSNYIYKNIFKKIFTETIPGRPLHGHNPHDTDTIYIIYENRLCIYNVKLKRIVVSSDRCIEKLDNCYWSS